MGAREICGYEELGATGDKVHGVDTTLPASGAALTLYQTTWRTAKKTGLRHKMLVFSVFSSHDSAASGFKIDESWDGGTNWDNTYTATILASTATKIYWKVSAPELRVTYTNSAAQTTTFRWSLLADSSERGNG